MIKIAISIRENFFISPPPFWVYYSILGGGAQEVRQNSFARSATSLGVSPHHLCEAQLHLHEVQPRSFVSACGGMMLTFGQMMLRASTQMMLCPADTTEKILKAELSGFFGAC